MGTAYAIASTLSSYYWLKNFGEFSLWTVSGVTVGYIFFYRAFFSLLHYLLTPHIQVSSKPKDRWQARLFSDNRPLVFAVAWTAFEFFKSRGYLAFPWNLAAFPFHNVVLVNQAADVIGVFGLSFVVFLLQAGLAELVAWTTERRAECFQLRYAWSAAALVVCLVLYGAFRLPEYSTEAEKVDDNELVVLLIQQNIDSWAASDPSEGVRVAIDLSLDGIHEASTQYHKSPDMVVWSETSLPYPYQNGGGYWSTRPTPISLQDFIAFNSSYLITGAPIFRSRDPFIAYNASLLIGPDGETQGEYGKIQLIPFAEHVPFTDFPPLTNFLEDVIGIPPVGWTAGEGVSVFHLNLQGGRSISLGTPICFEDSFAKNTRAFVQRGAQLLVNITNNSWSQTGSAQMQHLVSAKYRAIENRRNLLRSTNGGVTCHIGPDGRIIQEIPMFQSDYLLTSVDVPENPEMTVYTRFGDWFAWLSVLGLLAMLAIGFRKQA